MSDHALSANATREVVSQRDFDGRLKNVIATMKQQWTSMGVTLRATSLNTEQVELVISGKREDDVVKVVRHLQRTAGGSGSGVVGISIIGGCHASANAEALAPSSIRHVIIDESNLFIGARESYGAKINVARLCELLSYGEDVLTP
jgi:hypothetical protein